MDGVPNFLEMELRNIDHAPLEVPYAPRATRLVHVGIRLYFIV